MTFSYFDGILTGRRGLKTRYFGIFWFKVTMNAKNNMITVAMDSEMFPNLTKGFGLICCYTLENVQDAIAAFLSEFTSVIQHCIEQNKETI